MDHHLPQIMGILNVTPDSFSDGGKYNHIDLAVAHARKMAKQGADIIDIGGESTRPGADFIGEAEELKRIIPVIENLSGISAKISIDTRRPNVARAAIKAGAHIWNDVTALSFDANSPSVAAELGCKIILMHMQGDPQNMQDKPHYKNVVAEIMAYLQTRVSIAVNAGVARENITLDPGLGFGKRLDDNLDIMQKFDDLHALGFPVLIGASRKSFIGQIDGSQAESRLGGSIACALWAASLGASIVRVHDVKETAQALKVWRAIREREDG